MLKHIVMWKIADNANGKTKEENIDLLIKGYDELKKIIPTIANAKMVKTVGGTVDLILITEFESKEKLDEYVNHPDHQKYSAFCQSVRESRECADFID